MASIDALENLPEIDLLAEEGITFETIRNEMVADYEAYWKELTGEDLTLNPADSRRIMINVTAGKLYQLASIIGERHRLNYLQYMYGDYLKNWGSNFGFKEDGIEPSRTVLRFYLSEAQTEDVIIPEGTRATAGDNVFFATDEELTISAGEVHGDVTATCTVAGSAGNDYTPGQIAVITDPVFLVAGVENLSTSIGGHDEYTDEELRELIYNFPATYSTAGPEGCYEEIIKAYSSAILDARVITNEEAVVCIYLLLTGGELPDETYIEKVTEYLHEKAVTPDTDKVIIKTPEIVEYSLDVTYYIPANRREIADTLKSAIEDAVAEFTEHTKSKIGRSINPNTLISFAQAAGAARVKITSPEYQAIPENAIALCNSITINYGGLESE